MAISRFTSTTEPEAEAETEILLAENTPTVGGYVDCKGQPSFRSTSGCWKSASFIIGLEVAERCVHFGIASNLISYLTGPLGESTAAAAANVNAWSGTSSLLPLLCAFVIDSYVGRYRAVVVSSLAIILGLGMLIFSALQTSLSNTPPQTLTITFFFISLYLVAIGKSGVKPSIQAFGADQFDERSPKESKSRSSFFNWWYLFQAIGTTLTLVVLIYIQDNINWALAFAILCVLMIIALVVFLLGTKTYRYRVKKNNGQNPFAKIGRVFVLAVKNRRISTPDLVIPCDEDAPKSSQQFKFLNKAMVAGNNDSLEDGKMSSGVTVTDIEEAKALMRLLPIWATVLVFAVACSQSPTFFTKQGATINRTIFPGIEIPAASLQIITTIVIIAAIPIYDRIFVPIARIYSGIPSGITTLQRIGTGMVLTVIAMTVAGLVELKRLDTAEEYGLIEKPNEIIPMSFLWMVPQYVIFGVAEVFTLIGMQEFFYCQVPTELKSLGIGLYLSVVGLGSLLSSVVVSVIDEVTSAFGGVSWFATNLNEAHLDYFYWLLAALNALSFIAYLYFTKSYFSN